MRLVTSA